MTRHAAAFAVICGLAVLSLAGCEKGKPRHLPPDPFAQSPGTDAEAIAGGLSAGLTKRAGQPGYGLDHIGAAIDPLNRPPAPIAGAEPIQLDGFAFDMAAKLPALGVDVVIDGKAYSTLYGKKRKDVAAYFKVPALIATGFRAVLAPGTLKAGSHIAVLRVVSSDGKGFYDAPPVAFVVK